VPLRIEEKVMPQAAINRILTKFQIGDEDIARIRAVAPLLKLELPDHIDAFYNWMQQHQEFQV
jgi:hypothetical protein